MLSNCQKTAVELAARVASAKRDQALQISSLEDQLRYREELLLVVKTGTDAANALKVLFCLPREGPRYKKNSDAEDEALAG